MYKVDVEGAYTINQESMQSLAEAMKALNSGKFSLRYSFVAYKKGTRVEANSHLFRESEGQPSDMMAFVLTRDYEVLSYVKMNGTRFSSDWRSIALSPSAAMELREILAAR